MQDHEMKKNSGFTLIEIVLSLTMLGFMSIVAGMGIVSFTKGFVFVKKKYMWHRSLNWLWPD